MPTPSTVRAWRERLNLSRDDLAKLTGYSIATIYLMERGLDSNRKPLNVEAFRRYKAACLGITVLKHYKQPSLDTWEWTT